MKFMVYVEPRSPVHALWNLQARKRALLHTILFLWNPALRRYEAQELTPLQIKIAKQYPQYFRLELLGEETWKGEVPLNPTNDIYNQLKSPLTKLAENSFRETPVEENTIEEEVVPVPDVPEEKETPAPKKRGRPSRKS